MLTIIKLQSYWYSIQTVWVKYICFKRVYVTDTRSKSKQTNVLSIFCQQEVVKFICLFSICTIDGGKELMDQNDWLTIKDSKLRRYDF